MFRYCIVVINDVVKSIKKHHNVAEERDYWPQNPQINPTILSNSNLTNPKNRSRTPSEEAERLMQKKILKPGSSEELSRQKKQPNRDYRAEKHEVRASTQTKKQARNR